MAKIDIPKIPSSEITPEHVYINRRQFMRGVGLAAGALAVAACAAPGAPAVPTTAPATDTPAAGGASPAAPTPAPSAGATTDELGDPLTTYEAVTTYNNYYEFGTDKGEPAIRAKDFQVQPWNVQVGGLVNKPATFGVEDLTRIFPPEERIYRLRCVEAWSMVIPWLGFQLSSLLKAVEPTSDAKYVRFTTLLDPQQMPGQRSPYYQWPYVEGLRLDEAMNDLAIPGYRPVRQAVPAAKRRADSPRGAVEIRLQEHQVDREDRPGDRTADFVMDGGRAERVRLLRQCEPCGGPPTLVTGQRTAHRRNRPTQNPPLQRLRRASGRSV